MRQDREVRGFRAAELDESVLEALGALAADIGPGAPGDEHDEYLRWRAAELRRGRAAGVLSWSDMKSLQVARRAFSSAVAIRARLRVESGMPESVQPRMGFRGVVALPREALQAAASEGCAPWLDLGVAAGVGRELWDEPCEQWVRLPDDLPRGRFVALTVAGDSMEPLIRAGDEILVDRTPRPLRDGIHVVRLGEVLHVKRLQAGPPGRVVLISANEAYPPMEVALDEIDVIGRVVWKGGRV